ncbi:hypothetical protein TYRP_018389 [Tyrophagus putrescentiae]|nr:hypothetical protein TYRP_018389 [Tyrophagus putrescentiae]
MVAAKTFKLATLLMMPAGGVCKNFGPPTFSARALSGVHHSVDGHHCCPSQANVVLQGQPGVGHLSPAGQTAQLPAQFDALRHTGGAQLIGSSSSSSSSLTTGVNDPLAAVGVVGPLHQRLRLPNRTEAQCLVGDQLIGREAIVQFDDVHLGGGDRRSAVGGLGRQGGHLAADQSNGRTRLGKGRLCVGDHLQGEDLHRLCLEVPVSSEEVLTGQENGGGAVRGGTTLHFGEKVKDGRRAQNGSFQAHVFPSCCGKKLRSEGRRRQPFRLHLAEHRHVAVHGRHAVPVLGAQRPSLHLLEAHRQDAVIAARLQGAGCGGQRRRPRGAVVVDVDNGNAGHAEGVERSLATGGVAEDVTGGGKLHTAVLEVGVSQGSLHCHLNQIGVVDGQVEARSGEGRHADADDKDSPLVFH